jgi:hypothetical protein
MESPVGPYFIARFVRLPHDEDRFVARLLWGGGSFGSFTSPDCSSCLYSALLLVIPRGPEVVHPFQFL